MKLQFLCVNRLVIDLYLSLKDTEWYEITIKD